MLDAKCVEVGRESALTLQNIMVTGMLELMSEETRVTLLSFSIRKKLTFLMLLYERMIPELRSFCLAESHDFSIFQKAHNEFWRYLAEGESPISWAQLTQDILDATPSTVDFGTLEGSFA